MNAKYFIKISKTSNVIEGCKSSSNFVPLFLLPNTFIYESILIKIHINVNIMKTQKFHLNKYDLKANVMKFRKAANILKQKGQNFKI